MLDHLQMEEVVRSSLGPASELAVSRSAGAHHQLTLTIDATSPDSTRPRPERVQARIVTNGVDAFLLDLDGRFEYRDIDWDSEGQKEILTLLTMLAEAYLAGNGREAEKRGALGRRHGELTLELAGQTYRLRGVRR